MAATATQQILNDGPRNLVLKYTIAGTTGDTTEGILVNASDFNDAEGNALGANSLTLMGINAALTGCSIDLLWDATTNVKLAEIPIRRTVNQNYEHFGGIKDNSGAGSTGDVLFTTTAYSAGGDGGHIYLEFKKT